MDKTQEQAMKTAKATQKPGQTKDQTKLIAQGIQKGIAEYKKQQGVKSRERDKLRKSSFKSKDKPDEMEAYNDDVVNSPRDKLPWVLLLLSWFGFICLYFLKVL